MTLRREDYSYIADVLEKNSGLILGDEKEYLLESRLEPIWTELGLKSLEEFIRHLRINEEPILVKRINDAMTTNETLFFRDETPFQILRDLILPRLIEARESQKKLRIWCAACSTGQEPYSIAMLLMDYPKYLEDWDIQILATDISAPALQRAKDGIYWDFETQRGLTQDQLKRFFEPHPQGWQVKPELKRWIRFEPINITQPLGSLDLFDVVFCRYVMIYFNGQAKGQVFGRIHENMASDGYLFLGGTESASGFTNSFELIPEATTSVYRKVI